MRVCSCFLLFGIFAYTNSISQIRPRGHHRVLNLQQETVRENSDEEYSGDTNNLDDEQYFITRGTTLSSRNKKLVIREPRVETLTDFIQEAVKVLNTYEDIAYEDFFHVLDSEIRKYHYRGCKFSELTQNFYTRSLLAGSLKLIREKPVSFTKANINELADMMRDETYDKNVKELLDYINSLYRHTEISFHSILNELEFYRNTKSVRTHNNLVQVIRGGVRAILFNPYSELDTKTRRELKERIELFWKQFRKNPASRAVTHDIPNTDPEIKNSFTVTENIMNEVKTPKLYSKNDPQIQIKNKGKIIVSEDSYDEQFHHNETEKDESSSNSGEQKTNINTDEISSGQSFDSSSNSIKNSQERHEEYNTQRYMTLYTEEIYYSAKTTKKTEIIPISTNVVTRRPKVKKLQMTTSTPRELDVSLESTEKILRANLDTDDTKLDVSNSSHDTESGLTLKSKHESRAREKYDKERKQFRADDSKSKSKPKNVEIISQYNAVIDVQLANTDLLKSLRMFEPTDFDMKYDTTLNSTSALQIELVPTKFTIHPRFMRAQAEIRPQKPTARSKPRSRYSKKNRPLDRKQLRNFRKNIATSLPNKGHPVDQFMKDKNQTQKYLSNDDFIEGEDFKTYVIKRINAMENELNEFKKNNDFSFRSRMNDTYEFEARNFTEKFEVKDKVDSERIDIKGNVIERLLKEVHDLNNEEVNDGHDFSKRNKTMNTESSTNNNESRKLNVIKKDAVDVTVIDNKNTTQVTNNISKINVNITQKLNNGVIHNNVTTSTISLFKVANATKHENVVTTPTVNIIRRTMAYSEPFYYDSQEDNRPTVRNSQFDSFLDHINDGIDLPN